MKESDATRVDDRALVLAASPESASALARLLERLGVAARAADWSRPRLALKGASIIVVEAGLELGAALGACRDLRARASGLPILCRTPDDGADAVLAFFEAGADGCVSGSADPRVLAAHVEALVRRYRRASESRRTVRAGLVTLDYASWSMIVAGRVVRLTAKEFSILEALAQNADAVVPRRALMDRIRLSFEDTGSHALETHVANIRAKLGAGHAKRLKTVHGVGYTLASR